MKVIIYLWVVSIVLAAIVMVSAAWYYGLRWLLTGEGL